MVVVILTKVFVVHVLDVIGAVLVGVVVIVQILVTLNAVYVVAVDLLVVVYVVLPLVSMLTFLPIHVSG